MRETALRILNQNPLLHMGMIEPIRRGTAELLAAGEEGVLLREQKSGAYMLTAPTPAAGRALIGRVPPCPLAVVHQPFLVEPLRARLGLSGLLPCHQAVYLREEYLPLRGCLEIRRLDGGHFEEIRAHYDKISREELRLLLQSGALFGGYRKGELAGFVGNHLEGSIGLLEVFPAFRRRGFGSELETYIINRMKKAGRVPFAQVVEGNEKSLALQRKLGLTLAEEKLYWLL